MRVNVDSAVFTDARFKLVARATGLKWHDVIGKCVHIWMSCYDQRKGTLRKVEGDCLVDHDGFIQALCDQGLAVDNGDNAEVKGFKQRAGWLKSAEESGKAGGVKSGESRRNKIEGYPSENRREPLKGSEGSANPLTLTLAHAHALKKAPSSPPAGPSAELAEFHRAAAELGSEPLILAAEENPPGKKTPRRKPARALPADWAPNDAHRAIAAERRIDVSAEAVKFRDYGTATGKTYADHDAAFRNWLRGARLPQNGVQLARGSQAPRKFRDYLSELAARTSESEKLLETTGEAGESEVGK